MPTVLRYGSMRVQINIRDEHEPPHVHVRTNDGEVVVTLAESTHSVRVRTVKGPVRATDVAKIEIIVAAHFDMLVNTWSRYHR